MSTDNIITIVVSLLGILIVGLVVPFYLVRSAARERREDQAEAARQHREDREAEWARQDQVAKKAAESAQAIADGQKLIAQQAADAAALLLANNEKVSAQQDATNGKLDQIHTLVNSNMTAAMQSELDAVRRELILMNEIMSMRKANGQEPTKETMREILLTEQRVHELEANLRDRNKVAIQISSGETGE